MQHHISDGEWMDYMDGTMFPKRAESIQTHVAECVECEHTLRDLTGWHEAMLREGARLRTALQLPDEEMRSFIARSVEIIAAGGRPESRTWSVTEGVFLMRSLMEPLFGAGTARATIDLAVQRSTPYPEDGLGRGNWRLFITNLSETVESICGSAAGRLVSYAGTSLAIGGA